MVLWWEATPTSLNPAGCPADCTGKSEYQYSILEGETKSYGLLELGTIPELNINGVSSFNFS